MVSSFCPRNGIVDLLLAGFNTTDNLLALDLLERVHLVQLLLKLIDKSLLIVFGPCFALLLSCCNQWSVLEVRPKAFL